jgi:hypothetical protein
VISLATANREYPRGLARLQARLRESGFPGDVLVWPPGSFPAGCPTRLESPFAFKPFCFREAAERGYESILWLDSSCVPLQPLDPLFDELESSGTLLFRNRDYRVGEWCSDDALAELGLTRDEACDLPEVNAAAVGLDLRHPVAATFLEEWHAAAVAGTAFRGTREPLATEADYHAVKWNREGRVSADPRVRGHRHDQTVAGVLAHRLGLPLREGGIERLRRGRGGSVVSSGTVIAIEPPARPAARSRIARLLRR